jgi:hypothetical protein|tara:strand:- start:2335 stop:2592 length:258 start_codon:yes stop_codon:yes gene_type:complete
LRARRFVPQEAFKQFKDTEDWRKENKLDLIFETIEVEEYEQTRRLVWGCAYDDLLSHLTALHSILNGLAGATSAAFHSSCSRSRL